MEKSRKLVSFPINKNLQEEFKKNAMKYNAEIHYLGGNTMSKYKKLASISQGEFQFLNMCLSLYTLDLIEESVVPDSSDVYRFKLPLRCEILSEEPLVVLDGSHNLMKIEAFMKFLDRFNLDGSICIYSTFEDKKYTNILKFLSTKFNKIIFTEVNCRGRKSPTLSEFKSLAMGFFKEDNIYLEENNLRAYKLAKQLSENRFPIVSTGSFHHSAKIRELKWNEERIIFERKVI